MNDLLPLYIFVQIDWDNLENRPGNAVIKTTLGYEFTADPERVAGALRIKHCDSTYKGWNRKEYPQITYEKVEPL